MALDFTNNATDRVNHGSAAILDDLDPITYLIWCYPTTLTTSIMFDKRTASDRGYRMLYTVSGDELQFQMDRNVGVNPIAIETNGSFLTVNTWQFLGAVADSSGAAGDQKLFRGTLTSAVTEAGSYANQTVGSGFVENNASGEQLVGNRRDLDFNYEGHIAWAGIWNVALTDGQIRAQQFRPYPTSGCVLFCHYGFNGTGTQVDYSGNGNAGTVTGATQSVHAPVATRWFSIPWTPVTVAAPEGRTTKNTDSYPLGVHVGMAWRINQP
jgi:hypothetical protein